MKKIKGFNKIKHSNVIIISDYSCAQLKGGHGNGNGIPPDGDVRAK